MRFWVLQNGFYIMKKTLYAVIHFKIVVNSKGKER